MRGRLRPEKCAVHVEPWSLSAPRRAVLRASDESSGLAGESAERPAERLLGPSVPGLVRELLEHETGAVVLVG